MRSCCAVDEYAIAKLPVHAAEGHFFIFIVATCGDGDVPLNMRQFWNFIRRIDLPVGILSDLRFAVFGLGDRAYVKFNAAARKLSLRLSDLGASAIVPTVLGDESAEGGFDKELLPWSDSLSKLLLPDFQLEREHSKRTVLKEPRVTVQLMEEQNMEQAEGFDAGLWAVGQARHPHDGTNAPLFEAQVLRNEVLTNEQFLTDDKEVRHLELDLSRASAETGLRSYVPGDIVHVMPRNRESAVDAFFKLTGFNEYTYINLKSSESKSRFGSYQLNINFPCTLWDLVSTQLDLSCIPRRSFFERLAPFATDEMQREKLLELASAEGAEMLTQYAYREKRTILMVLRDFPSARPPLADLIDMTPVLKSRPFSIASSREGHPDKIHICASIVKYTTPLRFARVGVCSSFFLRLKPGDIVPVFLEKGTSLRFKEDVPSVMISPGTGVAPMRSFISSVTSTASERILFFGCRGRHGDYLYDKEWKSYLSDKKLSRMFTAFSRETEGEKIYVQQRLSEQRHTVWKLISEDKGNVYVAGSSGAMPKGVRQALVEICKDVGSLDEADAEQYVRRMEAAGRLQMECW